MHDNSGGSNTICSTDILNHPYARTAHQSLEALSSPAVVKVVLALCSEEGHVVG